MITAGGFVIAAAVGAVVRAAIARRANRVVFPWGTLVVNISGSFALGLLHAVGRPAFTVVGVGGLGAYTTFSSFARDAVALYERRTALRAATYVVLSVTLGVGAAALGIACSSGFSS